MRSWILFVCVGLACAQTPTCNDVRTVLAAKDCCQVNAPDAPSVDEFVWRSCTLTVDETACTENDVLVRTGRARDDEQGTGPYWECRSHQRRRELSEDLEQQLNDLQARVAMLEQRGI